MDLKSWIEPLFTYGPYAAVVLFLSVALFLLKGWAKVGAHNRVQQVVYGFYTAASWIVVIIAVRYIYVNWPPTMVYSGSLGTYEPEPAKFFSQSTGLFVRSTPTPDGRFKWEYVVVIRQPADDTGVLEFTYQWGTDKDNYRDYRLDLAALKQGHRNVTADPNQPGKLFYDGNDPATPRQPLQIAAARRLARPLVDAGMLVAAANAQARPAPNVLIQWLDSSDANLRAQARAQLRQMPPAEVRQLLSTPGLSPSARQQIQGQVR